MVEGFPSRIQTARISSTNQLLQGTKQCAKIIAKIEKICTYQQSRLAMNFARSLVQ